MSEQKPLTPEEERELAEQNRAYADAAVQDGKVPLLVDDRGRPLPNLVNAVSFLENTPAYKGQIWYDTFLDRVMTGDLLGGNDNCREWTDTDDLKVNMHLQGACGMLKVGVEISRQAAAVIAHRKTHNCVTFWISSLKWDKQPRIEHFFEDHFGTDPSLYTRGASKNFWISIVARAFRPGCKVDNMIVLEGGQGIKKSSALHVIGGSWFAEQTADVSQTKSFAENMIGKLIVEIPEMDSFSRAEVTRIKAAVSNSNDRYRDSYGRHSRDHLRQCVIVGTTNKDDWNRDETGARRFWPIRCSHEIDLDAIRENREQYFAEAYARYKSGESWWTMPTEETLNQQKMRYDADPWLPEISTYVTGLPHITANELLRQCLKIDLSDITKVHQMRVTTSLRFLGWSKGRVYVDNKLTRVWEPPK